MGKGLGTSRMHFSANLALLPSPTFTFTQPAVHEYIFVHQDHSAKSNNQTPSDCNLFWNLKCDHWAIRYAWWWM